MIGMKHQPCPEKVLAGSDLLSIMIELSPDTTLGAHLLPGTNQIMDNVASPYLDTSLAYHQRSFSGSRELNVNKVKRGYRYSNLLRVQIIKRGIKLRTKCTTTIFKITKCSQDFFGK